MKGKSILVAGCSGLLGCAVTKSLIEKGVHVIAADISPERFEKEFTELSDVSEGNVEFAKIDITNEESIINLFDRIEVDGAINCTYPRNKEYGKHFFDVSLSSFNENLSLHLGSAFLFTQQAARYFEKNKKPFSLVNVSSIYGVVAPKFEIYNNTPMTMPVEYAAIKSALIHLNKYVVSYINDSRFRINSISPGGIYDKQPEEFLLAYKKQTHGKGMLDVSDMLGTILFLLSDESKYITGQNIIVDDGFSL